MRNKTHKLVIGLIVIAVLCFFASAFLQFSVNWAKRFLSGQHPFGGSSIHRSSRENFPSVVIESGRTVCCRMKFCDFRFPLPKGTSVMTNDPIGGGFDTIKGAIYVTNADGGTVNLQAYRRRIWKDGFCVNASPDSKFTANSPDGGALEVETSGRTVRIAFSFFGDY